MIIHFKIIGRTVENGFTWVGSKYIPNIGDTVIVQINRRLTKLCRVTHRTFDTHSMLLYVVETREDDIIQSIQKSST